MATVPEKILLAMAGVYIKLDTVLPELDVNKLDGDVTLAFRGK